MAEPRYLAQYAAEWNRLPGDEFRALYQKAVLIGAGMSGDLGDFKPSRRGGTIAMLPRPGAAQAAAALVNRVWRITKSGSGPRRPGVTVGRSADNDVVVPEYSASQHHCEFRYEPGRIMITDLGSLNGTRVAGVALEPNQRHPVADGDRVVLGRYEFEFLTGPSFVQRVAKLATSG